MAFTTTQLETLESAIASGTRTVKYEDREVTYQSLEAMLSVRDIMKRELGTETSTRYTLASYDRT